MCRDTVADDTEVDLDGLPPSDEVPSSKEVKSFSTDETDGVPISATQGSGVEVLWDKIEETVLRVTGRQHIKFNVPSDGSQLRHVLLSFFFHNIICFCFLHSWLHQNSTVTAIDTTNENTLQVTAVISQTSLAKYKAKFITKQNT